MHSPLDFEEGEFSCMSNWIITLILFYLINRYCIGIKIVLFYRIMDQQDAVKSYGGVHR